MPNWKASSEAGSSVLTCVLCETRLNVVFEQREGVKDSPVGRPRADATPSCYSSVDQCRRWPTWSASALPFPATCPWVLAQSSRPLPQRRTSLASGPAGHSCLRSEMRERTRDAGLRSALARPSTGRDRASWCGDRRPGISTHQLRWHCPRCCGPTQMPTYPHFVMLYVVPGPLVEGQCKVLVCWRLTGSHG